VAVALIRVDVLGGLRVLRDGRELRALATQPRRAALLALLAVERECARERVLDVLWGERDPERARRALNQTVYELRRQLGEQAIEVRGERIAVASLVQTDVGIFQQAAQNGDLAAALEIYRGPFLDGSFLGATNEFEEWCARHRSRLARQHRKLRLDRIEELRRSGRLPAALALAARAADEDPADDDYQHHHIALLIESGQRAPAVRAYEAFAARLAAQDLAPLDHTRALLEQLQPAETTPPAVERQAADGGMAVNPSVPSESPVAARREPVRRARLVIAAAALVLVTLAGFDVLLPRRPAEPTVPEPQRLAVLPFEDQSADRAYAHLAGGLGVALTGELQQRLPDVAVLSSEAAARLRGADADSVARALGPALLITGSFARVADSVRLSVQIVDAATQNVVRATEVREPWSSELRVLDVLTARVLETVRPALGERHRERELRSATRSAAAFERYLRAVGAADAGRRLATARDWDGAEHLLVLADSLLAEAEQLDAGWAQPTVLRAEHRNLRALLLIMSGRGADTVAMRGHLRTALAHADRAVLRDGRDAAARALRGALRARWSSFATGPELEQSGAWLEGAAADLRAALALDPRRPEVWLQLAHVYYRQGQFPQALNAAENAERTDVYGAHTAELLERLSTYAFESGSDEAARRWCDEGYRRFPDDVRYLFCRSVLLAAAPEPPLDSLAELVRAVQRFPRASGFPVVIELNYALGLARAGERERAEERIAASRAAGYSLEALWREATVRAALQQPDRARALLREFERQHPEPAVRASRMLAPLRDAPAAAETRISSSR
jgi:DNA-binding SARP family transcriptional activator/TolB-like protein